MSSHKNYNIIISYITKSYYNVSSRKNYNIIISYITKSHYNVSSHKNYNILYNSVLHEKTTPYFKCHTQLSHLCWCQVKRNQVNYLWVFNFIKCVLVCIVFPMSKRGNIAAHKTPGDRLDHTERLSQATQGILDL